IDILMGYMPEQLSDEALKQIVQEAVAATGATSAKDMGKVIGAVMPKVKGKAEGTRVSALVKELLG
ncbi:MAG TPA: GatB/YqeY domain-containing protein, partial [Candidatus Paceibacterota bacterium]|nr:GatB/YqeY domain-containing protein [Candidatus Paceibacterota bacterium]